jgi:8-oxo-dGTP pyrophosphatase MutT (NUDIX family)
LINKACPVLLRQRQNTNERQLEVLAFRHPLAGLQLVKGTIEPGELPAHAALRELWEEAGIEARVMSQLGTQTIEATGQLWHFYYCAANRVLPDQWQFYTQDDGGHWFEFFWHPLVYDTCQPSAFFLREAVPAMHGWHPMFQQALVFLQQRLTSSCMDELNKKILCPKFYL